MMANLKNEVLACYNSIDEFNLDTENIKAMISAGFGPRDKTIYEEIYLRRHSLKEKTSDESKQIKYMGGQFLRWVKSISDICFAPSEGNQIIAISI